MNKINNLLKSRGESSFDVLKESGRIFFVDYGILENNTVVSGRICYPSIGLFYMASNRTLLPLAVQLTRNLNNNNEVYTPLDREEVWLLARTHLMHSDALTHEFVSHLCFTHLAVEPIAMAFYRTMDDTHPLMQLMKPHFKYVVFLLNLFHFF